MRRVVVTGIGVVSALGPTREHFWNALKEGCCGIRPLVLGGNLSLTFKNGAQVLDFDSSQVGSPRTQEFMDRFSQLGVVAAEEAIKDSGIELNPDVAKRAATITGSCLGGILSEDEQYLALYRNGKNRAHPMTIPRVMANAAACQISMRYGLRGPSLTVSSACASSSHALGHAFWLVRSGIAEIAISGGSEAPFALGHLKAWEALRVISPDTCRPFSMNRTGTILGEGAAMLLLEPAERAIARGAHIYAEIAGYGMTSDAQHLTQPSVDGATRAMALAMEDAGLNPEQVTYVNAHGTATQANDIVETKAIKNVLGGHSQHVAVSSTKSLHGHALGAAGALEAAATILAIERSRVPPTANYTQPDPDCDLDVVPNASRALMIEAALSNSFAFGGMNAVLAFRRWK
jgi:nodulation protein E